MNRMIGRCVMALLVCTSIVGLSAGAGRAAAAAPAAPAQGKPDLMTTYRVSYTKNTVAIDQSAAARILKKVSRTGASGHVVYYLAAPDTMRRQLHVGSILFLAGKGLGKVRAISTAGAETVVDTTPAALTDAVQSGTIGWVYKVNFGALAASPQAGAMIQAGGLTLVTPRRMRTGGIDRDRARATGREAALDSASVPLTFKGTIDGFDVSLTMTPAADGLSLDMSAFYLANGVKAIGIKASGHLNNLTSSSTIDISGSRLQHFSYNNTGLQGDMTLEWHAFTSPATGAFDAAEAAKILSIPVKWSIPFTVGFIPVVLNVKAKLVVAPALEDTHSSSGGRIKVTYNSSTAITSNGAAPIVSGSLGQAQFAITGETVSASAVPVGLGLDIEFPRIELSFLNTLTAFASLDYHAYGYFTPGTTLTKDIKPCQKAGASLAGYGGVQLSFFGLPGAIESKKQIFKAPDQVWYKDGRKCD